MAKTIIKFKTHSHSETITHELGKNNVTAIKDNTLEYETSIYVIFDIYVNNNIKYRYENGVYEIEYE